jgi:hypothetical protein
MRHRLLTLGPDNERLWVQRCASPLGDQTKALKVKVGELVESEEETMGTYQQCPTCTNRQEDDRVFMCSACFIIFCQACAIEFTADKARASAVCPKCRRMGRLLGAIK